MWVVFPGNVDVFSYVFFRFEQITYCNMFNSWKTSRNQALFPGNAVIFSNLGKHQQIKHCFLETLSFFVKKQFTDLSKKSS